MSCIELVSEKKDVFGANQFLCNAIGYGSAQISMMYGPALLAFFSNFQKKVWCNTWMTAYCYFIVNIMSSIQTQRSVKQSPYCCPRLPT